MANSTLATARYPAAEKNMWGTRGVKIDRIIVHHMAAVWSAERCAKSFQNPSRGASVNYCIGKDGEIAVSVDEELAGGSVSNRDADIHGVTIETSNSAVGGEYPVSDKVLDSLIKLCADIAKRNGLGKLVKGKNLCWHGMYAATACPGQYLLSKMDYIAQKANEINYPTKKADGTKGELAGVDIVRGENQLVLYVKGLKNNGNTGTNKWGYEVQIDKNGVVLADPVYKGNSTIPTGGKVLSGHGTAGEWIKAHIKAGYLVWFENGKTQVSTKQHRSIDGENIHRATNYLCIYNKGKTTGQNKWGTEVAVDKNGKITEIQYGKGNMTIATGGKVLSGHGTASKWLKNNCRVGYTATISNGKVVTITK